jgi:hypothetical protein
MNSWMIFGLGLVGLLLFYCIWMYLIAKAFKLGVLEVILFYSPLFSLAKFKVGHTLVKIGWLPLGSGIRLAGMEAPDPSFTKGSELKEEGKLYQKPILSRLLMAFSGPMAYLVCGAVLVNGLNFGLENFAVLVVIAISLIYLFVVSKFTNGSRLNIENESDRKKAMKKAGIIHLPIFVLIIATLFIATSFGDQVLAIWNDDINYVSNFDALAVLGFISQFMAIQMLINQFFVADGIGTSAIIDNLLGASHPEKPISILGSIFTIGIVAFSFTMLIKVFS